MLMRRQRQAGEGAAVEASWTARARHAALAWKPQSQDAICEAIAAKMQTLDADGGDCPGGVRTLMV